MRDIQRAKHNVWIRFVVVAVFATLGSYSTRATTAVGLNHGELLHAHSQQDAQAQQAPPAPPTSPAPSAQDTSTPSATHAPKTSPAKTPAATAARTGTPAVVVDGKQIESVLGKKVQSAKGDDMGRIVDIIVDKSGQVRAAIIDFGGFLGVGSRQIAVAWSAIHFTMDGKSDAVEVGLTLDQLRVAPIYKPGEQIVVLGQPHQSNTPKTEQSTATPAPAPAPASEAPNAVEKELPAK
jgi:hypothetical protein